MCLILVAQAAHPDFPLVVAANRDEFYARSALPAAFQQDAPSLLMGKDMQAFGTWLGVAKNGRFAAVTNARLPTPTNPPKSRGLLVVKYLQGSTDPFSYAEAVKAQGRQYRGFSLLVADGETLCFTTNQKAATRRLPAGIYGLANRTLDSDCPKVQRGKALFAEALQQPMGVDVLLELLSDRKPPRDRGMQACSGADVDVQDDRRPCFVAGEAYGTRASTVILIRQDGLVQFAEQSYLAGGAPGVRRDFSFRLAASVAELSDAVI